MSGRPKTFHRGFQVCLLTNFLFYFFSIFFFFVFFFEFKFWDHKTFLGNCLPTPPLSQHFALSEKYVSMVAYGRGRWAVSQKRIMIPNFVVSLRCELIFVLRKRRKETCDT